jgi:hypothetical protein
MAIIEIYDEESFGADQHNGTATIDLGPVRATRQACVSAPVVRPKSGKQRGTVSVDLWFEAAEAPQPFKPCSSGITTTATPLLPPSAAGVPVSAAAAALGAPGGAMCVCCMVLLAGFGSSRHRCR